MKREPQKFRIVPVADRSCVSRYDVEVGDVVLAETGDRTFRISYVGAHHVEADIEGSRIWTAIGYPQLERAS